jgi:hypothetical protein
LARMLVGSRPRPSPGSGTSGRTSLARADAVTNARSAHHAPHPRYNAPHPRYNAPHPRYNAPHPRYKKKVRLKAPGQRPRRS